MEEHQESHEQAPVSPPTTMTVGQTEGAQVQVAAAPVPSPVQTQLQPQQPVEPSHMAEDIITWEASDHIDYDNGTKWMILMIVGGLALAAVIFILVDLMSAIVVLLFLGGIIFYSKLKPQNVRYTVSSHGISVGGREYRYTDFRSFSFNTEDGITSIFLVPLQRFMVPITMYVAPDNQDKIASVLAQHLPNKQRKPDFMDRLTAKLRL